MVGREEAQKEGRGAQDRNIRKKGVGRRESSHATVSNKERHGPKEWYLGNGVIVAEATIVTKDLKKVIIAS